MRSSPAKSTHFSIPNLFYLVVLTAAPQLAAKTVQWQEGKLIKSELLDPNQTSVSKPACWFFNNLIHTVETEDFIYKFFGTGIDLALVPDRNDFKFKIAKDGRVSVQDKRGHEQQTSLRVYAKATKITQAVAPLPPNAKHRDWRVVNIMRMKPVLYSFNMPWVLSTPEPPCPFHLAIIRGWAFQLDADGTEYEVVQTNPALPALTVSNPVRIAEKGKNEAYVLDQAGKERKLRVVKKTIQNSVGP